MTAACIVPPLKPGIQVRASAMFPYTLPKGLPAGSRATVLRVGNDVCLIRDEEGHEWQVSPLSLDPRSYVRVAGRWVENPEE